MTREELLILLVEECGEVIQAATKCLRFGWDRYQPEYGVNHEVLAMEVGDLVAVIDALNLDRAIIAATCATKIDRAEAFLATVRAEQPSPPLSAEER